MQQSLLSETGFAWKKHYHSGPARARFPFLHPTGALDVLAEGWDEIQGGTQPEDDPAR
jgi:hypothetical protein